ncbi:MAG: hypothetical protein WB975_12695 [Nitrososphaeraceae archaeon]
MELIDKSLVLDFEKYLEKKKRKIGNASHGFDRGQHELITQLSKLRKLEKQYGVNEIMSTPNMRQKLMDFNLGYFP